MLPFERRVEEVATVRSTRPAIAKGTANLGTGALVAAENDDGVVVDTGFLDRIQDLSHPIVHLGGYSRRKFPRAPGTWQ